MKKTQTGTHLPTNLQAIVKEICGTRGLSPARDLHLMYEEALIQWIESIDRSTGRRRMRTSWGMSFPSVLEELGRSNSDAELFQALDKRPLMTWVSGPDHGCVFVSRELVKYTGKIIDQLCGLAWLTALVHPGDRRRLMEGTEESYAAEQASQIPYRIRRSDGVYVWVMDAARPRFHPDGRLAGYVGTLYVIAPERDRDATPHESVTPIVIDPRIGKTEALTHMLFSHALKLNTPVRKRDKQGFDSVIFEAKHSSDD